jgi:hypothetical protein
MKTNGMNQKTSLVYFMIVFLSIIVTMLFHEFGHFVVGISLGHQMHMDLGFAKPFESHLSSLHLNLITLGGPLFTLFQIIIVAFVLLNRKIFILYPFLIAGAIARMIPYINVFFNYNMIINEDEAKLSTAIGLSPIILPIIFIITLIGIVIYVNYKLKISYKKLIITIVGVIISSMIYFGLIIPLVK